MVVLLVRPGSSGAGQKPSWFRGGRSRAGRQHHQRQGIKCLNVPALDLAGGVQGAKGVCANTSGLRLRAFFVVIPCQDDEEEEEEACGRSLRLSQSKSFLGNNKLPCPRMVMFVVCAKAVLAAAVHRSWLP